MDSRDVYKATEEVLLLLERSKQRVDRSIDSLPGIYLVLDETGRIYRHNDEISGLLNPKKQRLLGGCLFDYVDEKNREKLNNQIRLAQKENEKPFQSQLQLKCENDQLLEFSVTLIGWTLKSQSTDEKFLYTLHGRDVTDLQRISAEKNELEKEIVGAEQLQKLMLPHQHLEMEQFELACYYRAASNCGGDFLHHSMHEGKLRIWAGDVTGHGVGAAMVSGGVRAAIAIMEQKKLPPTAEAMQQLHQCLFDIAKGQYWMTFLIFEIDFKQNTMEICNAAHESIYLLEDYNNPEKTFRDFKPLSLPASMPLGSARSPIYKSETIPLKLDTLYFCASDGLTETVNSKNKAFSDRRMLKSLLHNYQETKNIQETTAKLIQENSEFREFKPMADDISTWTLIVKE